MEGGGVSLKYKQIPPSFCHYRKVAAKDLFAIALSPNVFVLDIFIEMFQRKLLYHNGKPSYMTFLFCCVHRSHLDSNWQNLFKTIVHETGIRVDISR